MSSLIGFCIVGSCVLLVLGLILGPTDAGKTLRRWALFLFVAALMPAFACGILQQAGVAGGGGPASPSSVLAVIGGLAILSVIAYVTLAAKGLVGKKPRGRNNNNQSRRGGYRPGPSDDLDDLD